MTAQEALAILEKCGARQRGHFQFGERHTAEWVTSNLYCFPEKISRLASAIAEHFEGAGVKVVAGVPRKGGIIFSQWIAHHLAVFEEILAVTLDHSAGEILQKKRVLVVGDYLRNSELKLLEIVEKYQGSVEGIGVVWSSSSQAKAIQEIGEFFTLIEFPDWSPQECPQCAQGIPLAQL